MPVALYLAKGQNWGMAAEDGHVDEPSPWLSSEAWARRLSPQAYAGTVKGAVLALGVVVVISLLLVQDISLYRGYSSLPLSLILVAAAGWFLGKRALAVVAAAAVIGHSMESWLFGWGWFIGAIGVIGILLVGAVARLIATGRERHRQLAEQERRLGELTFLLNTAEKLAGTLDENEILGNVVEAASRAVSRGPRDGKARASYHELRGGDSMVIKVESDDAGTIGFEYPLARHPAALAAIKNGAATVAEPEEMTGPLRDLVERLQLEVVLCAPVRVGERVAGILTAGHADNPNVERRELRLLDVLARLAGLAIGNAEHLRREKEHAERIQSLEKAKSHLLMVASHELRGPLTVARGYVQMLADGNLGDLPEQPAEVVPIVASKLTEMELLVDQMLEASRLEERRVMLRQQRTDLRKLANEAVVVLRPMVGVGRQIALDLPDREVAATVDAERVLTILTNLLSNAVKYSPNGGDVRCRVSATDERARIAVRDRGIGIAPEDLDRLFTRFGRIVTPDNADISGTGLGLYVARELAREHGGDITVISALGRGSEFTLELPLTQ
jgi:signal transduction histidine kinase